MYSELRNNGSGEVAKNLEPQLFQGKKTYTNYFEDWCFKLVDASEEHILAIIPGIMLGGNKAEIEPLIEWEAFRPIVGDG